MLQFQQCCYWQSFVPYGFNDQMTSWRNRKGSDAQVAEHSDGSGARLCLDSSSSSSNVGGTWNDRASATYLWWFEDNKC